MADFIIELFNASYKETITDKIAIKEQYKIILRTLSKGSIKGKEVLLRGPIEPYRIDYLYPISLLT